MSDLREQLLKAGLVDKKSKQKADAAARRKRKKKRKKSGRVASGVSVEEERRRRYEERIAREAAENRARAEREKKEREAEEHRRRLRNLAVAWKVKDHKPPKRRWHFVTRENRISSLDVSAEMAWQLEIGSVAVVERPGDHDEPHGLVSWEGAERIYAVEPECVRFWNRRSKRVEPPMG
jgi:uncharacterized protein YaiL (DUF2058 family)